MHKGKRIFLMIFLIILLLCSLAAVFYPAFYSWYSEQHHTEVWSEYKSSIENTDTGAIDAAFADAREYNRKLAAGELDLLDPKGNGYYDQLNLTGNGIIGFLEIPKIDLSLTVYHGTSSDVLSKGVGHMEQTSLPTGNAGSHAVLSAHTGTTNQRLFTDLVLLEVGDIFYLTVMGEKMAYQVDQIKTVLPHNIDDIQVIDGEDLITLSTCTPYGVNSHRLLVRGKRVALEEAEQIELETKETAPTESLWTQYYIKGILCGLIGAVALILLVLLFLGIRRRGKKKKQQKTE